MTSEFIQLSYWSMKNDCSSFLIHKLYIVTTTNSRKSTINALNSNKKQTLRDLPNLTKNARGVLPQRGTAVGLPLGWSAFSYFPGYGDVRARQHHPYQQHQPGHETLLLHRCLLAGAAHLPA